MFSLQLHSVHCERVESATGNGRLKVGHTRLEQSVYNATRFVLALLEPDAMMSFKFERLIQLLAS